MLSFLRAIVYVACHPFDVFSVTVVRRYVDAQGHYIGELYEGNSREARMIGASCDNLSLQADSATYGVIPNLCYRRTFLEPMPLYTLRVGAMLPKDNAMVQAYVSARRWLPLRVTVLNRFVEHVLGGGKI
jgi:hypothetical protein